MDYSFTPQPPRYPSDKYPDVNSTTDDNTPARLLKPGMLVKYNDRGPFKVVSIEPVDKTNPKMEFVYVTLSDKDNPNKTAKLKVNKFTPAFEIISKPQNLQLKEILKSLKHFPNT